MNRHVKQIMAILLMATGLLNTPQTYSADDNLLAYRLFTQGDYVRAAEIFTDPAWKGLALYRSSQWWRAAEAFARANDALSTYNLGNCYVQLGYYALALDAFQQALSMDPALEDAQHNADIMRALLTRDDEQQERGGRQPSGDEIDRLESDSPEDQGARGEDGEKQASGGENAPGESSDDGTHSMGPDGQAQAGLGGEANKNNERPDDSEGEGSGAIDGKAAEQEPQNGRPSGGSETEEPTALAASAGMRTELETEQATTQWLNRIQHDSQRFLQRRLKLEQKRRNAAGQSPPQGGSTW
ncbi:MAG: tetratricopeptide repeat protein [Granulosicoccus sp.]